jgi:hypothetical protein
LVVASGRPSESRGHEDVQLVAFARVRRNLRAKEQKRVGVLGGAALGEKSARAAEAPDLQRGIAADEV